MLSLEFHLSYIWSLLCSY